MLYVKNVFKQAILQHSVQCVKVKWKLFSVIT